MTEPKTTETPETRSEGERYYDETVRPALEALSEECVKRGMPFLAVVEYDPSGVGVIIQPSGARTPHFTMTNITARFAPDVRKILGTWAAAATEGMLREGSAKH